MMSCRRGEVATRIAPSSLSAVILSFAWLASGALASTCGGYPTTECPESHHCCAADSADGSGFCCPGTSKCAFGINGLGSIVRSRVCCEEGRPVCGVGVGAYYCCMGPLSKLSVGGCAAHGPPVCCNEMCGDELCDSECKALDGECTPGAASEGGKCVDPATGSPIKPPPLV
mmetsp:Transcript_103614/g.299703  ORF Transcript_103614/g.299703 Transcript_103614/m.299703 type:complete len:172 (-) Transcript_103614:434-949(-)